MKRAVPRSKLTSSSSASSPEIPYRSSPYHSHQGNAAAASPMSNHRFELRRTASMGSAPAGYSSSGLPPRSNTSKGQQQSHPTSLSSSLSSPSIYASSSSSGVERPSLSRTSSTTRASYAAAVAVGNSDVSQSSDFPQQRSSHLHLTSSFSSYSSSEGQGDDELLMLPPSTARQADAEAISSTSSSYLYRGLFEVPSYALDPSYSSSSTTSRQARALSEPTIQVVSLDNFLLDSNHYEDFIASTASSFQPRGQQQHQPSLLEMMDSTHISSHSPSSSYLSPTISGGIGAASLSMNPSRRASFSSSPSLPPPSSSTPFGMSAASNNTIYSSSSFEEDVPQQLRSSHLSSPIVGRERTLSGSLLNDWVPSAVSGSAPQESMSPTSPQSPFSQREQHQPYPQPYQQQPHMFGFQESNFPPDSAALNRSWLQQQEQQQQWQVPFEASPQRLKAHEASSSLDFGGFRGSSFTGSAPIPSASAWASLVANSNSSSSLSFPTSAFPSYDHRNASTEMDNVNRPFFPPQQHHQSHQSSGSALDDSPSPSPYYSPHPFPAPQMQQMNYYSPHQQQFPESGREFMGSNPQTPLRSHTGLEDREVQQQSHQQWPGERHHDNVYNSVQNPTIASQSSLGFPPNPTDSTHLLYFER